MAKIAYCLYGQPRNFAEGYKNIEKFVEKYEVDFYYHTWTLSKENSYYSHSEYRNIKNEDLKSDKNIKNNLNLLYNPKAYVFNETTYFDFTKDDNFLNSIVYLNTLDKNKGERISHTLSNFYSKQQVRNLLYDTIQKEQISYDFVIICRFDFLNEINFDLTNINKDKIYVSDIHRPRFIFSDAILLLNVENFLKLFDLYNNLPNLINNSEINSIVNSYDEHFVFVAESLLLANYLYNFKNLNNIEYSNFPNFC